MYFNFFKNKTKSLALMALMVILSGCGNIASNAGHSTTDSGTSTAAIMSALSSSNVNTSNWYCPGSANVTLHKNMGNGGYDYSGNNSFTVCVSRTNTRNFLVTGYTSSKNICIYPMSGSSQTITALADSPQCFAITGKAINVTFSNPSITKMEIIDSNYTNAFTQCLSGAAVCPAYSEGIVQ